MMTMQRTSTLKICVYDDGDDDGACGGGDAYDGGGASVRWSPVSEAGEAAVVADLQTLMPLGQMREISFLMVSYALHSSFLEYEHHLHLNPLINTNKCNEYK